MPALLKSENATQAQFNSVFGVKNDHRARLHSYLRQNKSDVFVYYSGHGAPDVKTKTGYFVPVDCDPSTVHACVLTSSTGDQISSWYPAKKHGLYTYYFLKGLQGEADDDKDGIITGGELHDYLDDEVEYMARRLYMREQHPQIMGSKNAVIVKYR
jgi:hypothetical protein